MVTITDSYPSEAHIKVFPFPSASGEVGSLLKNYNFEALPAGGGGGLFPCSPWKYISVFP